MRTGRPKGSKKHDGKCNGCKKELVVGENIWPSMVKSGDYLCFGCNNIRTQKWQSKNLDKVKGWESNYRMSKGVGVYQVMLGSICLYVGEGQIKSRKESHMKYNNHIKSSVAKYCFKHNISRSLLSFNVLEYEDDTTRRKDLEDWYITFLTPIINPKPPLGLYV